MTDVVKNRQRRGAVAVVRRTRGAISDFVANRGGDIAIMFGLMALAMFAAMGAAVDIARWLHARQDTLAALDAAVLAGGRQLQVGADHGTAEASAMRYYKSNTKSRLPLAVDTIAFSVQDDGMAFGVTGNASIETPVLAIFGIDTLPLLNLSGSEYSKAQLAVGGNSDIDLEIGLMLDVSGSMAGTKVDDMKEAAKDLVNIVVWDDQSEHTARVALVPFSAAVRPPTWLYDQVADPAMSAAKYGPGHMNAKCGGTCQKRFERASPCAVERSGTNAYTDALPSANKWIMPMYVERSPTRSECPLGSRSEIVPLSNDKAMLVDKIDRLTVSGTTAGHLGTAWAWYMISPKWAPILPEASKPAAYDGTKTNKIAILMTDGEYNTQYTVHGIASGTANAPTPNSPANATSDNQAKALCTAMKAEGITVYTVGFDLGGNQSAINTLERCATTPGHAYLADDGAGLKQAFRDIALKISALYLSK
ncbi:MAG: VWA domain-containing protein [Hyphomicrobium sp.]|nr:VWA domain-containing protein [Hyphomicrobium sp.]